MSRSLTYAEMAEALKITPESANRLARRRRWPRVKGNDGRTRVAVPEEALVRPDSPQVSPTDSPPIVPSDNHVHMQIARLEGELVGTREALAEARARAGAAEARAEAAETRMEKAVAAFAALAERLDALADSRRPWWRRLVG